jgi:hypothetical protein
MKLMSPGIIGDAKPAPARKTPDDWISPDYPVQHVRTVDGMHLVRYKNLGMSVDAEITTEQLDALIEQDVVDMGQRYVR